MRDDRCPETVFSAYGVAACRFGWKHEGRCEPLHTEEELTEMLKNARAGEGPSREDADG